MRRLAVVVAFGLCACGAPDDGLDGLYGSGGPEDQSRAVRGGDPAGGDDDDTASDDDGVGDPGDPSNHGDPVASGDGEAPNGDGPDGDLDCPPPNLPPPLACPTLDCPTWEPWCDGDSIVITGSHFAHPGQAGMVVRFQGDYTAVDCAAEEVDVRYRATYESATQASFSFDAASPPRGFGVAGGSFNGTMFVVNVEPDGTEWTSNAVSVSIAF